MYDALNRRTIATYADASNTVYTYDKGNRLLQINDSTAGLITRTYDGLNRLTSEQTPQGTVGYTYDAASRRATMTVPGQALISYSYDNGNRLTQITQGSSIVQFGYDNANRRTSLTLPNNILVEYAYDAASRVTSITYKQNGTTVIGDLTYEYDKAGNRTKTGGSWARTGMPEPVTATSYDANNRQLTFGDKILAYDDNGNLQSITDSNGTTLYSWNARNQLVGISGPSVNASFVYDGIGRREKKTINGNLTEFLYDRRNPVQETSGATVLANILPGLGIDEFLTRTDVVAGTTSNFLTDALRSPVVVTDNAGTVQTEYTYEPFGKTTVTGNFNSSSYQYTGRENDGTGLYYYRKRYYHPELQRFMSEDPIEYSGGDINLFSYVQNSPLGSVDSLGLFPMQGMCNLLIPCPKPPKCGNGGRKDDPRCPQPQPKPQPPPLPPAPDCDTGRDCDGAGPLPDCVTKDCAPGKGPPEIDIPRPSSPPPLPGIPGNMGNPNDPYNYGGRTYDPDGNPIADYSRGITGGGNQMGGPGAWTLNSSRNCWCWK